MATYSDAFTTILDDLDATTGWAALGNDTTNLATTTKHVSGTAALTFDKANGAANTVFAAIAKTLTSVNLGSVKMHDSVQLSLYVSSITDVAYGFIRLGTDSSNYNEWRIPLTNIIAGVFQTHNVPLGEPTYAGITGNGWNPGAVTYACIGVAFNAESNTLTGIVVEQLAYCSNNPFKRVSAQLVALNSAGGTAIDPAVLAKAHDMDSGAGTEYAVGISLRKSASGGSVEYGTLTDPIRIDTVGTTTQPVNGTVAVSSVTTSVTPGTGATNLGKAEDAGHTNGDVGVMALGVANTGASNISGTNADYTPLATDLTGALRTIVEARAVTVLASAARTSTQTGSDQTNITGKGIMVVCDVTAIVSAPSITVDIQVKDAVSSKYISLLISAAIVATGTTRLRVYPGFLAATNTVANDLLSRTWRIVVTHANANSITYSVGAEILP